MNAALRSRLRALEAGSGVTADTVTSDSVMDGSITLADLSQEAAIGSNWFLRSILNDPPRAIQNTGSVSMGGRVDGVDLVKITDSGATTTGAFADCPITGAGRYRLSFTTKYDATTNLADINIESTSADSANFASANATGISFRRDAGAQPVVSGTLAGAALVSGKSTRQDGLVHHSAVLDLPATANFYRLRVAPETSAAANQGDLYIGNVRVERVGSGTSYVAITKFTDQTFAGAAGFVTAWDTALKDPGSKFNLSTGQYVATHTGSVDIMFTCAIDATVLAVADDAIYIRIEKNGGNPFVTEFIDLGPTVNVEKQIVTISSFDVVPGDAVKVELGDVNASNTFVIRSASISIREFLA